MQQTIVLSGLIAAIFLNFLSPEVISTSDATLTSDRRNPNSKDAHDNLQRPEPEVDSKERSTPPDATQPPANDTAFPNERKSGKENGKFTETKKSPKNRNKAIYSIDDDDDGGQWMEKPRKTGKGKNNQKAGGRRHGHRVSTKLVPSSYADSLQADSGYSRINTSSSSYRKQLSSGFGDKSNEAWRGDKGASSSVSKISHAPAKTCQELTCAKAGQCVEDRSLGTARCQCQLGTKGQFCEKDVAVKYPKFFGSGYIAFPVLRGAFKEFTVDMEFKPDKNNGLLLFSSDHPEARFDFFSVSIVHGHVEFRFDCGTGMGLVRTKNTVQLEKWNHLKIYRNDWNGYVKLNDGPESKGKSKGVFTKMSFREHLFLGGYRNTTSIELRTGVTTGFSGCVRYLRINQKVYDMRKGAFVGDALYGLDVDECNGHVCDKVKCLQGGSCTSVGADSSICLCPVGTIGDRCQTKNDVQIPSFGGHSYLQFIGLRRTVMSYTEIEVVFKASDLDGLLLYNGYATDGTGDFISLALHNGTVEYRYDLGTGPAIIRSREPITVDTWHTVRVTRNGRHGQLQLDGQHQVEGSTNGAFTQLTLTLDLFIGGHRNFDETAKAAGVSKSLKGCIQKVTINEKTLKLLDESLAGVNIDNCHHPCATQPCKNGGQCVPLKDQYQCSCQMGFENSNCQDRTARYRYRYRYRRDLTERTSAITVPRFSGNGFLMYTEPEIVQWTRGNKIEIQIRLKASRPSGLIFYVGEEGAEDWGDYLAFGLVDGHLQLGFNLGDGEAIARDNSTRLDDGRWHTVRVERYDGVGFAEVDGQRILATFTPGSLKQLNTDGTVYVGGMADVAQRTLGRYDSGFYGCLSNLTLASRLSVDLIEDADVTSNVGQCG